MRFREHFIIDGYNVIHQNSELKDALLRFGWSAATERLINLCLSVLTNERCVTIVFDGNGERNDIQSYPGLNNFRIVFSSSRYSADAIIEKIIMNTKKPTQCTVVTNDGGIIDSIFSNNANFIKSQDFFKYINELTNCIGNIESQKNRNKSWKLNKFFDDISL